MSLTALLYSSVSSGHIDIDQALGNQLAVVARGESLRLAVLPSRNRLVFVPLSGLVLALRE